MLARAGHTSTGHLVKFLVVFDQIYIQIVDVGYKILKEMKEIIKSILFIFNLYWREGNLLNLVFPFLNDISILNCF